MNTFMLQSMDILYIILTGTCTRKWHAFVEFTTNAIER